MSLMNAALRKNCNNNTSQYLHFYNCKNKFILDFVWSESRKTCLWMVDEFPTTSIFKVQTYFGPIKKLDRPMAITFLNTHFAYESSFNVY